MNKRQNNKVIINAAGRSIGRLATEVAIIITGKNSCNYTRNNPGNMQAIITNIDKMNISEKKLEKKIMVSHSGYPGGIKTKNWKELYNKNPQTLFLKVINNMIPNNKLKKQALKNIKFE